MINARNWHRDTAYFFVGLIISFSISGIALNHRTKWNPRQYVISSEEIKINLPDSIEFNENYAIKTLKDYDLENKYQSFRVRGEDARIYFEGGVLDINLSSGKGSLEFNRKRPLMTEMTLLHQTTNEAWIWYSDIFGLGMLLITITGMFIAKGSKSFRSRGWKLAIAGIVFPLIFLLFLL